MTPVERNEEDKLSDRELVLILLKEVRATGRRLERLEANQTLLIGWAREVALTRGNDHVAGQIDAYLSEEGDTQV